MQKNGVKASLTYHDTPPVILPVTPPVDEKQKSELYEMHCRAVWRRSERAKDDRVGTTDRMRGRWARV